MPKLLEISQESRLVFGTSGARGLVSAMTEDACRAYIHAFRKTITPQAQDYLIGQDLRPSSTQIAHFCAAELISAGCRATFAGALPTPALAFYAMQNDTPAVMVTGSHIPFDRNGIKFYRPEGEITKQDEVVMLGAEIPTSSAPPPFTLKVEGGVLDCYLQRYKSVFPSGFLKGKTVGIYQHSSVARDVLSELLEHFGAKVIALGRCDEFVPIDTEAVTQRDTELAKQWSGQFGLDAIVSADGDGDRPLIANDHGEWLRGDIVGLLCARELCALAVVAPVSCNSAIESCGVFKEVFRTKIGSPYVIEGMQQAATAGCTSVVGFEANGGFLLGTPILLEGRHLAALPTRDAVLPVLTLLWAASKRNTGLSELALDLPARFTQSNRLANFPLDKSRELINLLLGEESAVQLRAQLIEIECGELTGINAIDGVRMKFENGEIVHLRPSGNAPELRCYAEASTSARAQSLCESVLDAVEVWASGGR